MTLATDKVVIALLITAIVVNIITVIISLIKVKTLKKIVANVRAKGELDEDKWKEFKKNLSYFRKTAFGYIFLLGFYYWALSGRTVQDIKLVLIFNVIPILVTAIFISCFFIKTIIGSVEKIKKQPLSPPVSLAKLHLDDNIKASRITRFINWLARVVLFITIWVGFVYGTANYFLSKSLKDSEGIDYYFYAGLYATWLVGWLYIAIDYIARKKKWDEKSLWNLFISAIIFALITSYFWVNIMLLLWVTQVLFLLLPVFTLIIGIMLVSKFK